MAPAKRIGIGPAFMLLAGAIFFDGAQIAAGIATPLIFPIAGFAIGSAVNVFIDVLATMLLGFFLVRCGIGPTKRRPFGFLATVLIECIPFIDDIPEWTLYVGYSIARNWIETRSREV